jgi:hypothetical protein
VQQCLRQAGVQCSDAGPFSLRGTYLPTAKQLAAVAAAEAGATPAAKRSRAEVGGGAPQWQLEVQLFQQYAGLFLLTAALPKAAPDGVLPWFGGLAQQLQAALAEQWTVA